METKKKPQEYQSKHKKELDDIYEQITTRKPFTFDLDENSLYQQYKNQYVNLGQQAMADTQGKAAGLTGGFSSSYSQNVGQQAYNAYLQQLNELVPDLYAQARSSYDQEGQNLLDLYNLKAQEESKDYARWQDAYDNWLQEYGLALKEEERQQAQENWQKEYDRNGQHWQAEFDRDKQQWQAEFDRNKQQWQDEWNRDQSRWQDQWNRDQARWQEEQARKNSTAGTYSRSSSGGGRSSSGSSRSSKSKTFEPGSDPYLYVLAKEWMRLGKGATDRWRFLKAEGYPWEALAEFNRILAEMEQKPKKNPPKAPPHSKDRVNLPY